MQNIVGKWKRRSSVTDLPTGPKEPSSTVLTIEDEAVIAAFRKHTLLRLICRPAIPTWRLGTLSGQLGSRVARCLLPSSVIRLC